MFPIMGGLHGCSFNSRFAWKGAQKAVKQFAEEMWKKGGIRMVILSGFKDKKGEIFSQV